MPLPRGPVAFGDRPPISLGRLDTQHQPPQGIGGGRVDPLTQAETQFDWFRRLRLEPWRTHLRLPRGGGRRQ